MLSTRRIEIITYAQSFLGTPYVWGGKNRLKGLDCSGFVCEVLRAFGGVGQGDLSSNMLKGRFPMATAGLPEGGELLFFGPSPTVVQHVAIALPNLRMIEAGRGNQSTTTFAIAAEQGAMVCESMITRKPDFLGWSPWPGLEVPT